MVKIKILNYFFIIFLKFWLVKKVDEEIVIWVYKYDVYRKII